MAQSVWVLSVDLQTKTATFQSGMADAARAAKDSFTQIKSGAAEMGAETGYSMTEARHGVMLLGEEFGIHLPRGVTSFLASLGPVGAAMEAAFPFLAIAVGATFLIEKLTKIGEEGARSGQAWAAISDEIGKWAEHTKASLLDMQIQLDRLNGDNLKELRDTLKKIDMTTLDHLKSEFDGVGKKVDEEFTKMRSGWLMTQLGMGNGVGEVQKMFSAAMDKVNADLEKGDHKQLAADLKAASDQMWNLAEPTYALVGRLKEAHNEWGANKIAADGNYQALLKAHGVLESMTQELRAQTTLEKEKGEIATRTITPVHNATDPRIAEERRKQLAAYMESNHKKAEADEQLAEIRMRMEDEVTKYFAAQYQKQQEASLHAEERQHEAVQKAAAEQRADAEALRKIQQSAIDSGVSAFVISKQQEQQKLREILQKEQTDLIAAHQKEVAEQRTFIETMKSLEANSSGATQAKALADEAAAREKLTQATRQFREEMGRVQSGISAANLETMKLNNSWKTFFGQSMQESKSLAASVRGDLQSSINQATNALAQGLAKSIVESKSFAGAMRHAAVEISESMIENLIKWGEQDLITKLGMKASAASLAGANAVASFAGAPWPVDVGAPAFGATAAATAMAFEFGGTVPGVGKGDIVPAMLEPGEGVLTKSQMEMLSHAKDGGGSGGSGGQEVHIHHHTTNHIQALDSTGVDAVLQKHGDKFINHTMNHIRKQNR
jgi:hypothetical protein